MHSCGSQLWILYILLESLTYNKASYFVCQILFSIFPSEMYHSRSSRNRKYPSKVQIPKLYWSALLLYPASHGFFFGYLTCQSRLDACHMHHVTNVMCCTTARQTHPLWSDNELSHILMRMSLQSCMSCEMVAAKIQLWWCFMLRSQTERAKRLMMCVM